MLDDKPVNIVAVNEYGDEVVRSAFDNRLWCNPHNEPDSDDFYGSWLVNDVEQAWELCNLLRKHAKEIKALNLPKMKVD